jgi:uncharacterized membrane protein YdjX (TVP38/TMEM64 family)
LPPRLRGHTMTPTVRGRGMVMVRVAGVCCLVMVAAGVWYFRWKWGIGASEIGNFVAQFGILSVAVFVAIYTIMSSVAIPTLPLNLLAGMMWGGLAGGMLSCLGGSLGAIVTFSLARYLFGTPLATCCNNDVVTQLQKSFELGGWKFVIFTRINPIFPSFVLNYGFGLTSIRLQPYALATVAGLLVPSMAVSWMGENLEHLTWSLAPDAPIKAALLVSAAITALFGLRFAARMMLLPDR